MGVNNRQRVGALHDNGNALLRRSVAKVPPVGKLHWTGGCGETGWRGSSMGRGGGFLSEGSERDGGGGELFHRFRTKGPASKGVA